MTPENPIEIPENELLLKTSRSSGPGGQHINKVNTRVTLTFDLAASSLFTLAQKNRIRKRLRTRIDKNDRLTVSCRQFRSQYANRRAAHQHLRNLLTEALKKPPHRIKTKAPPRAIQNRLDNKKKRSALKKQRTAKHPLYDPNY